MPAPAKIVPELHPSYECLRRIRRDSLSDNHTENPHPRAWLGWRGKETVSISFVSPVRREEFAMLNLILASLSFLAIHAVISGTAVRAA
ncbi:MAG: hypothetical protein VCD66_10945, partial [Alphaproteobacteria bacterium]